MPLWVEFHYVHQPARRLRLMTHLRSWFVRVMAAASQTGIG